MPPTAEYRGPTLPGAPIGWRVPRCNAPLCELISSTQGPSSANLGITRVRARSTDNLHDAKTLCLKPRAGPANVALVSYSATLSRDAFAVSHIATADAGCLFGSGRWETCIRQEHQTLSRTVTAILAMDGLRTGSWRYRESLSRCWRRAAVL